MARESVKPSGQFSVYHQRSHYIYDLYYKRKEISKEFYEFCLEQGYADRNLIAKWKKVSYLVP
jgi:bud site selection protein 31